MVQKLMAASQPEEATSQRGGDLTTPVILLAGGEVEFVTKLRPLLEPDFIVYTAATIEESEALLQEQEIHILACDSQMPGEDGLSFLIRLQWIYADMIRILMSWNAESDILLRAINEGQVSRFLTKSDDIENIVYLLNESWVYYNIKSNRDFIEQKYVELKKIHYSIPNMSRRLRVIITDLRKLFRSSISIIVLLASILFVLGVFILFVLYMMKSWLGINIFQDIHFSDLF